jgi:hypothetical protein
MAEPPFVGRIHTEPKEGRRDMRDPRWEAVAPLLETLGIGDIRRLELWSRDGSTVMTVEGEREVFNSSIQVGETNYHCFHNGAAPGKAVEVGPFAYDSSELCRDRAEMIAIVEEYWTRGESSRECWTTHDATDALSPLNNTMAKAAAEVGAMVKALRSGNTGGEATMRVRGPWNASAATRADMKFLARSLDLSKLTVVDSDGAIHTFEGAELLPTGAGGKAWTR